jgi:DNA-binding HxlR family transcriptional regulator
MARLLLERRGSDTMRERDHLGHRTLHLLAEGCTVAVLRELAGGPLRPSDLHPRLPGAAHSAIMRALAGLQGHGALARAHHGGVPHKTFYSLTAAGHELLEIPQAAARWERRWVLARGHLGLPGTWSLRLIADRHNRALTLALADGPLTLGELHLKSATPLGRSALRKRVAVLLRNGVVRRVQTPGAALYELELSARRLSHVAMLAGRWEWRHVRPDNASPASDLASVLHVIAPLARVSGPLGGVCRLRLNAGRPGEPDVYLAAARGRVLALALAPATALSAECLAAPDAWCDALLLRSRRGVRASGDAMLVSALLSAVSTALLE